MKSLSGYAAWFDRCIGLEEAQDPQATERQTGAFLFIFLVGYATELINGVTQQVASPSPVLRGAFWAGMPLIALAFVPRFRAAALAALAAVASLYAILLFPRTGNHLYLYAFVFVLFLLHDLRVDIERQWLIGALRWILLVVLFYSGFQKLLHGYYTNGEVLAFAISEEESFRKFFGMFLPESEIRRLEAYRIVPGSGPYRLYSPLGLLISRGTVVAEMGLPLLLYVKKTRLIGLLGAIVLIVGIEWGAREFLFGILFTNLLLLFGPARWHWHARWFFLAFCLGLIMSRLGILPEIFFK
jgi:hypothetical protein